MQNFDFNEALKAIQSGKPITGSDGVLAPLIKQLTEAALSAEIDSYLEHNPIGKRRNGYSKKTVKSAVGSLNLKPLVTAMANLSLSEEIAKHRFARAQDEGYA